jgi:hypothetical protein
MYVLFLKILDTIKQGESFHNDNENLNQRFDKEAKGQYNNTIGLHIKVKRK